MSESGLDRRGLDQRVDEQSPWSGVRKVTGVHHSGRSQSCNLASDNAPWRYHRSLELYQRSGQITHFRHIPAPEQHVPTGH